MIRETFLEVKTKIEKSESIKDESKKELLSLLSQLQSEVEQLSKTDLDHAESIVSFARVSAHEATRKEKNPRLYKLSLDGLGASVEGFENTHPRLVETINSIFTALSNLGI
jgi:Domain of unknown function (DUF4404)